MPEQPTPDQPGPAGAAGSPDPGGRGRERLLAALFRPTRGQVVVAVLLALVGFAAVTQVRTNDVDDTYSALREQDLIDTLTGLAGTTQRAQAELQRLEEERDELLSDTSAREAALERAREEAATLSILSGLVPVTGPGIRVTIEESSTPAGIDVFIDMLQNLRTAGAEAIQVNGEVRVIAQTAFEQGAGGILVDGRRLTSPYVIDAIGEPDALTSAVDFPRGPREDLEADGATVSIDEVSSLDVEAVREPVQPEFASPGPDD